ncbi:alkaline phosphatase [Algibacter sp. Ld11]|uniref:alkaline phosphatase n=1 Tax=Algibacter sp. Ld11 TaxID=649150 RepID=UPI00386540F7
MSHRIIIFYISLIFFQLSFSQNESNYIIHSHNDYLQNTPFWTAFSSGSRSIEIDVFFKDNELFVCHTLDEIVKDRTVETLYLKPLENALHLSSNKFNEFYLMFDIKSEATSTLKNLIKLLKEYRSIIQNKNIKIVISGNRPNVNQYVDYPDYIYFDNQNINETFTNEVLSKVALTSVDFKSYSVWNGKGRLTHEDEKRVKAVIAKAKVLQKPFRFWGTPDSKTAWKLFTDMGVDFINTDMPFECHAYLKTLSSRTYTSKVFSEVYKPSFKKDGSESSIKNVILMIGDGNGLSQISSAVLANSGGLTVTQLKHIGLIKTQSADDFVTDSAAAGTALATGEKTNNRAIGVDVNGNAIKNITEVLGTKGFLTGCITTDKMTGATPSAFYAHQKDRDYSSAIAQELLESKLSLFIGGGANDFESVKLDAKFELHSDLNTFNSDTNKKVGVFISKEKPLSVLAGRGNLLAEATKKSLAYFKHQQKPFFIMIESAQIDSFGHENNAAGVISETIDFDRAITEAIKFAEENEDTLVIVTADHETSGFSMPNGDVANHTIEGDFSTHDHTGVMVPVFAYGARSLNFTGVYENNQVFHKILEVLDVD